MYEIPYILQIIVLKNIFLLHSITIFNYIVLNKVFIEFTIHPISLTLKDLNLRILDPRGSSPLVSQTASHRGMKDSKVVWVGEGRVLTSGFGEDRARELILRDIRNLSVPQHVLSLDVSAGILLPLYDPDTNMVFLTGKGDRYIQFVEVQDRDPWFVAGLRYTGDQIKGGCLVPKRAVDVMQCEVGSFLIKKKVLLQIY